MSKEAKLTAISQIESKFAFESLKAAFLLNGTAAISILTFTGSLATSESGNIVKIASLALPLASFSIGASLAVAGYGLAYFAAFYLVMFNSKNRDRSKEVKLELKTFERREWWFRYMAQVVGVISWIVFNFGIYFSYRAFSNLDSSNVSSVSNLPILCATDLFCFSSVLCLAFNSDTFIEATKFVF